MLTVRTTPLNAARWLPLSLLPLLLAGCGVGVTGASPSPGITLPDSVSVLEGATGARLSAAALLRRLASADFVLLGEVHDNAVHHAVRGQLVAALRERRPAIVFEQIAESTAPIAPPAGEPLEAWLDRHAFDRTGWKWPLHRPVVEAALQFGRGVWGSGLSRESLQSVIRTGEAAAPAHLRRLLAAAPLDNTAQAAMDRELVDGHCGQLPDAMIPGMRAAQTLRDASMANALLRAAETGPAWLVAGNGHVRRDIAVPRLLRTLATGKEVLVVGLLEREPDGAEPAAAARALYDVVIVTPRVSRADPCASFRR